MTSINFEEKSRGAKFLHKKKLESPKKVQAKDSEIEKLEINVTQNFEIKNSKGIKKVEDKN